MSKQTVTLNASNVRRILHALNGEPHHIRELQFTRNLPNNVINEVIEEFNSQVEQQTKEPAT